jgi:hypothetical protein
LTHWSRHGDRSADADNRATVTDVDAAVGRACDAMADWLRGLPEWPRHPTNPSGSVSRRTVAADIDKVGKYLRNGLLGAAYIVVIEECDHRFPPEFEQASVRRARGGGTAPETLAVTRRRSPAKCRRGACPQQGTA